MHYWIVIVMKVITVRDSLPLGKASYIKFDPLLNVTMGCSISIYFLAFRKCNSNLIPNARL